MNALIVLGSRMLLAAVFALAGTAKLANVRTAAQSLVPFGIPKSRATAAARALAAVELVCAALVLPTPTALAGSGGIAALLLLFILVIAATLSRGLKPKCHCFGQLSSQEIGPATLVRNTVLLAVAGVVVWDAAPAAAGQPGGATWPEGLQAVGTVSPVWLVATAAGAVLIPLAVTLVTVVKQYGRLLVRVERLEQELGIAAESEPQGLPVGRVAPAFTLTTLAGHEQPLASLAGARDTVALVFIEPDCRPCSDLLPDIAAANRRAALAARTQQAGGDAHAGRLVVALVSQGSTDANRAKTAPYALDHILLQREHEVADAFGVVGTPSAVLVRNGLIASPLAAGPDAVRDLLNGAIDNGMPLIGLGDEVPAIDVPDIDGGRRDLRSLTSLRTLLLFWNPDCGYCQQMLQRLKEWERRAGDGVPRLVVVSQGSAAANRAQELRSTTVLDDGFVLGKALGATGTPSAVLVEEGRVVSGVGVGATDVFALVHPGALATHA